MGPDLVRTSKFLSWVLRHHPEKIGLVLEHGGWTPVPDLIRKANDSGHALTEAVLLRVVAENDKQRFALTPDGAWIRANQGHSVDIDLGLEAVAPPEILYHGTAIQNLESIQRQGLLPGKRQHVHLSPDETTAIKVGGRHGKPVVLQVKSGAMYNAGESFFLSANGVWLTTHVALQFIEIPEPEHS